MTQRAEHGWPRPIPLLSTRVIVDHIANRWCSARWHANWGQIMRQVLDNIFWHALAGRHARYATGARTRYADCG